MFFEPWAVAGLYSGLVAICMTLTVFICICGCRAKERKDELVGIEGHVKMTNPESLEANEPNGNAIVPGESDRGSTTAKRSLPDLPVGHSGERMPSEEPPWEPNGDAVSELYATVDAQKAKVINSNVSKNDHSYDMLKKVEHPYAQVNHGEPSTSQDSTLLPPPSPLQSTVVGPHREIAAATAIAGHVHASDDLPYMTPPTHFSGDSQDSAKGYTSISVREPLATIRAETAEVMPDHLDTRDPHYTTVSDDSDDMYAAIEEPASGSETYAQIRPATANPIAARPASTGAVAVAAHPVLTHSRQASSSSAASSGPVNSPKPEKRQANSPLPAPPVLGEERSLDDMYAKVNKKKRKDVIEDALERGGSTESAMTGSSESVSFRLQSNNISTTDSSQSPSCHGQSTTSSSMGDSSAPNSRELQLAVAATSLSTSSTESPSIRRLGASDTSLSSDPETRTSYERLNDDPRYETLGKKADGYETLGKKDAGYESLNRKVNDPGYATLDNNGEDPCYSKVRKTSDPGYETLNNGALPAALSTYDSEPNYETLGKGGPPSDSDPNYERIGQANHDYASLPRNDFYATVEKKIKTDDPPYASLDGHTYAAVVKPVRSGDPPYATVDGCDYASVNKKPADPTYASLGDGFSSDPDYESVQYSGGQIDPPYQLLADFESGAVKK